LSFSSRGECLSIGVKARVLYSRLLSVDDYWFCLSSDTVGEMCQRLRATAYEEALSALPESPHRHDIESAIKNTLLKQAESFLIHMSSPRDKFFRAMMYRHEAENLKSVFRYVASGRTNRDELRKRLYITKNSRVSYDNLLSSRDYGELAESLLGSVYHKVLAEPLRRLQSGEDRSLFHVEMALDIFIELSLYKAMKKLDPAERTRLLPILGTRIDLFNLYILHRALKFYSMTPEETLNRLLPVRYRITMAFLREAARAELFEQVIEMLRGRFPVYAELLSSAFSDEEPQLSLERNIKRYVYSQARRVFGDGPPGFHTVVSYFILKEYEITDIIRIIEYIRYGHDRRNAAENLTRPITRIAGGELEWQ
jgi:V/A-type H+-transporting ATPase subunit C